MLGIFGRSAAVKNREFKYEIQVYHDGRWVIECVQADGDENAAVALARATLADERFEQVRIIRQRTRPSDGFTTETEIFREARKGKAKDVTVAAAADADYICRDLDDFYGLESRIVIGRVLREYLDKTIVTPTELLHNHSHLGKLHNYGNILNTAVSQVAGIQARAANVNVKERIGALYDLVNKATSRARDLAAERKRLPALQSRDLTSLMRRVEARFEPADRRYAVHAALANYLMGSRSWGQKLMQAMELADGGLDAEGLDILDNLVADTLGSGQLVKELLGPLPDLGSALTMLAEIAQGRLAAEGRALTAELAALNALIVGKGLPASRAVLTDRLRRAIKSPQPLSRNDAALEMRRFQELQAKLKIEDGNAFGGAAMAEAMAARQQSMRSATLRQIGIDH